MENARWVLSEILRVFWTGDRTLIARFIRELLQFEVPSIGEFGGKLLVQRTDCTVEEEVIVLLHHAGEQGLSRKHLGQFVRGSPSAISQALKKLISNTLRQVIQLESANYRLTDLGVQRVLSQLMTKLSL